MDCNCPRCGSENTQRLALFAASNTQMISSKSHTVAYSRGTKILVAATGGQSVSTNAVAQAAQPPLRPSRPVGPVILLAFMVIFELMAIHDGGVFAALFIAPFLAGAGYLFWISEKANRVGDEIYARELYEWKRRFLCLRCSHLFTPDDTDR